MKELFDTVLRAVPAYLSHVLELLSGPKGFIDRKNLTTAKSAVEAYTFLGVTLFIVLIAEVSFLPEQKDYLLTFASRSVQEVFFLIVMVAVLFGIWRIVGGKLSFKIFFIVTCYLSGISTLIFAVFALLARGWLKQVDPDNASQILSGAIPAGDPSAGLIGYLLLVIIGFIAVYVWIVVTWGAYRKLNNVSRQRSAVALILFTIVAPLLIYIDILIERNSMPMPDRATSARLPLDMVGPWKFDPPPGPQGAVLPLTIDYVFDDGGNYARHIKYTLSQGGCAKTTLEDSDGHASIEGSTLILEPKRNVRSESNSCSTGESFSEVPHLKEIYPFQIEHLAAGWRLCLMSRFGQQCFLAS